MNILLLVLFILVILGILLFRLSRYLKRRSGLPAGTVISEDVSGSAHDLLFSERLNICGKPDYLLKGKGGNLIPVEVKSSNAPHGGHPYESHLMQLAAYFLLIEEVLNDTPSHGLIRYRDRTLQVENSDELRGRLFEVIERMGVISLRGGAHRSHSQSARCSRCSLAHACDERIED